MTYLTRFLCVAILIWAIFSFSSRPQPKLAPSQPIPPPTEEEKISVKSSAPAKKKKSNNRVQELSNWIQEDLLCDGKGNYLRKQESRNAAEIYQALEMARGNNRPDPCLSALLTKSKKSIPRFSRQSDHESCQFIRALALTGQLGLNEKSTAKETTEGISLLRSLAATHSDNGIYPLFLLGADKNPEHLKGFLRARKFRNPLLALGPRLREIGFTNATALLFAIEALATMRVPDYQSAISSAREWVIAPELKGDYRGWLQTYLADLEEIQRLKLGEPFVWTIEIAALRSIAATGWVAHGEGAKPALLEQEPWKALFRQLTNMEALAPFYVNEEQACERIQESITALLPDFSAHSESMARRWIEYR